MLYLPFPIDIFFDIILHSYKFLNRILKIVNDTKKPKQLINLDLVDKKNTVIKKINQSIKDVTEGIENFRFNVCVAKLYELSNMISKINSKTDFPGIL